MENLIDLLPLLIPLVTAIGGWIIGQRMRDAQVNKTDAEAQRTLAEAERIFSQAESDEVKSLGTVISAWRTLFESTQNQLDAMKKEQRSLRLEYNRVLIELRRYKNGVNILINQLRRLGHTPEWTPRQDSEV